MPAEACGCPVCAVASLSPVAYLLAMTAAQPASPSAPSVASAHDKILIVDFGSQVTQLIARRVREEGVYSEIVPFQKAEAAFKAMKPKAVILSGGPASVHEAGSPRAPQVDLRFRRAGARHLLRRADDGASSSAAKSRAAITASSAAPTSRSRPRCALFDGVWEHGREASGLDEPWRPRHQNAAGFCAWRACRRARRTR